MVIGFWDGQGLPGPVNDGVGGLEPGESEDDVFLAVAHDLEEMFLDDPFDICVEGASVMDCTSFVCSLVHVVDCDGGSKFFGGEAMFPDKFPVDARDVNIRVYQYRGVNDFEGMQRSDQLNRDIHRFV